MVTIIEETPDPVDRTGPDRIPDQDIDFFENFVVFFLFFLFLIFEFEQKNHSGNGIDNKDIIMVKVIL